MRFPESHRSCLGHIESAATGACEGRAHVGGPAGQLASWSSGQLASWSVSWSAGQLVSYADTTNSIQK